MLNISNELKTMYKTHQFPLSQTLSDIQLKMEFVNIDLVIGNESIMIDTHELIQTLCSNEDLLFGSCESNVLNITLYDITTDIKGEKFILKHVIDGTDEVQLGIFTIDSCTRQENRSYKDITAYDNMKKFEIDVITWYNDLNFTNLTLKQMRESLCTFCGVEYEDSNLPNDNMLITKTVSASSMNGLGVLKKIEELNGAFGDIGADGKLRHVTISMTQNSVYEDITPRTKISSEEYTVHAIDKVQIKTEEGDIGAIYGTGTNAYVVNANFLCYGKTAEQLAVIAENLYSSISNITYVPIESENIGLPYLQVGDLISFTLEDDTVIHSFINKRRLKGIQSLKDVYSSTGNEFREQVTTQNDDIIQLQGKVSVLKRTCEMLSNEINDEETGIMSQILQLSDTIVVKVDGNGNLAQIELGQTDGGSSVTIKATNISLEGLVTANNNFKVLLDGSIDATNGKFNGEVVSVGTDALIKLLDGQIFVSGENAYLRGKASGDGDNEYSKIVGISVNGNIVLGHDETSSTVGHSQNINFYGNKFLFRKNSNNDASEYEFVGNIKADNVPLPTVSSHYSTNAAGQIVSWVDTLEDGDTLAASFTYNQDGTIASANGVTITHDTI